MNIIAQEDNGVTKIIVQNLEKKEDIKILIEHIKNSTLLEINFLNIQIIPKEVILKLHKSKDKITIYTNESTLKTYLMNLGFDLTYYNRYSNAKLKTLNLEYIVIGGSAGSLAKITDMIKALPKADISLFIVVHQKADKTSKLSNVLQSHTKHYKVIEAQSDMRIEPATIYTAPPGRHMIATGGFIFLTDEPKRNFSKPSLSTTFEALSKEYRNTLLCIILSGYGEDGSDSLKLLEENNTTVLVEDPLECEAKPMVENAIKTNHYDLVLPLEKIKLFISNNLNKNFFTTKELERFLEKINQKYGYDYTGYNLSHIKRRVLLLYSDLKPKSFLEFENIVLENKNIFKDLFLNISVNVTTFYRNPEVFKILKEEILPKLDSFMYIKIWCAGCSSGEEPYSIAIFLKELGLLDRSLIYATDLNDIILKNALNGLYSKESFNIFLKHYYKAGGDESFSQYFHDHDSFVELKDELKKKILFFRHSLVLDGKINDFQLIFCRNVLIYFDKDLKAKVFKLFKDSLDTYGFLVLGESESLELNENYVTIDTKNKIYKRKK